MRSLFVEQSAVTYSLRKERRSQPVAEEITRLWYKPPDGQRVEFEEVQRGSRTGSERLVHVWDGSKYWRYDIDENAVSVYSQKPGADPYYAPQGGFVVLAGYLREAGASSSCRSARVAAEQSIAGRPAYVLELGRPQCGLALPGADGRAVIWVDKKTGLVLRSEQYAADGLLFRIREVVRIEYDAKIDEAIFRFDSPPAASLVDRTSIVTVSMYRWEEPRPPISLAQARQDATFALRAPSALPAAFELESVQHYRPDDGDGSANADWILLRYTDAAGNWVVITQGYGGYIATLPSRAPASAARDTVDMRGTQATWLDGSPTSYWEQGVMTSLSWEVGRFGEGWEMSRGGEKRTGSPLYIALASNVLSVEQLKTIAESLE